MNTYSNNEIEISFDADRCIHAGECVKGLPSVFDVARDPWINVDGAETDKIVEVVNRCPSGALSCKTSDGDFSPGHGELEIKVMSGGPYLVQSKVILIDDEGGKQVKEGGARCAGVAPQNLNLSATGHIKIWSFNGNG